MTKKYTHPNSEAGETITLPQVYTCTMARTEATARKSASRNLDGVKFTILELGYHEKAVGETTVTNLADLEKLNERLGLSNKEIQQ